MSMSWPSVILLATAQECSSITARIRSYGIRRDPLTDGDVLGWKGYSYSLDFSGRVLDDFEPEEIEEISRRIGEPFAIYLSCESMDAARGFLGEVLVGFSGLIDTNHGDVVEFGDFLRLIENHPQWDWRRVEVSDLLDRAGEE
ncbi:hypothetical protein ACGF8B_06120 [Streptomyces sp. NPDC047917]|uniref:hypothetical protein n=1 Tax=Streptomyces sp. NPDC047917 TaxID=3365491 RepID=UPI00371DD999